MRGRWAAGIVPRNFCWVIKDHLAVSERPGGYAPNHRKVRRQEELLWLRAQGFTRVVSLLGSTHNLHAYEELGLEWSRFPMPPASETPNILAKLYPSVHRWLRGGERLLLHQEELGDCVMGVAAGYLLWSEILPDGPRAITAMEQLLRRQMGTVGRMIVAAVDDVPPVDSRAPVDPDGPVDPDAPVESGDGADVPMAGSDGADPTSGAGAEDPGQNALGAAGAPLGPEREDAVAVGEPGEPSRPVKDEVAPSPLPGPAGEGEDWLPARRR